ncbi:E3 ubiquitin-protein ligase TRIM33-like isoform X2 [Pseudomyrmex gracilis]|uniref:E3 ubiquitin-protein ligase TRIM33-like isoform X2 n=1 Tax=Pseudomyrmex gracilis TaxID=219809 RepID=UPI0009952BB3|nr:E3 ubiquitin-protein ligase TRIM33-like isoform X2 [Pseudomyrmex gracilis]
MYKFQAARRLRFVRLVDLLSYLPFTHILSFCALYSMNFLNCSMKRSSNNCCNREVANSDFGSCDHIYASLMECKNVNSEGFTEVESAPITSQNKQHNEDYKKKPVSWSANSNNFTYHQSSPSVLPNKMNCDVDKESKETTHSPYRVLHDANYLCPRCGQRMEEPRLLPCLHTICLSCVYELINKFSYISAKPEIQNNRTYAQLNIQETCPLCDEQLPNMYSAVPPPHYPLQHQLVLDSMRCKLINKVLCDTCVSEVPALMQCSTCLCNLCLECSKKHEQQNIVEAKTIKHLMRPMWEATKVRRTVLCQIHSTHALRFYCIACQQVTCKECMWSTQHRGHASEDAVGAGQRACAYLTMMLQKARLFLNNLLIQYNHDAFSHNDFDESQSVAKTSRYIA